MSIAPSFTWDGIPAPPLHTFTITFTGAPTLELPAVNPSDPDEDVDDDVPTFDVRDPKQREAFRDAVLGAFDSPTVCGCDDNEACGACGTDRVDPGSFRRDVFINIEVTACDGNPGWYIAQSDQFSQYGDGGTPYDALSDFFACMADHMTFLQRHEHVLALGLARELDHLRALAGNDGL